MTSVKVTEHGPIDQICDWIRYPFAGLGHYSGKNTTSLLTNENLSFIGKGGKNKLAKLRDAIAISNLKLSLTDSLTH